MERTATQTNAAENLISLWINLASDLWEETVGKMDMAMPEFEHRDKLAPEFIVDKKKYKAFNSLETIFKNIPVDLILKNLTEEQQTTKLKIKKSTEVLTGELKTESARNTRGNLHPQLHNG